VGVRRAVHKKHLRYGAVKAVIKIPCDMPQPAQRDSTLCMCAGDGRDQQQLRDG
jgi:hypothetical protein